jgi:predicted nucleic acid-binding protein
MAKVFLDVNYLIDVTWRNPNLGEQLYSHDLVISPASLSIVAYVGKVKCPSEMLTAIVNTYQMAALDDEVLIPALYGPTKDIEDNIQLQSALLEKCQFFLTHDNDLLKMGIFGSMVITSMLPTFEK